MGSEPQVGGVKGQSSRIIYYDSKMTSTTIELLAISHVVDKNPHIIYTDLKAAVDASYDLITFKNIEHTKIIEEVKKNGIELKWISSKLNKAHNAAKIGAWNYIIKNNIVPITSNNQPIKTKIEWHHEWNTKGDYYYKSL